MEINVERYEKDENGVYLRISGGNCGPIIKRPLKDVWDDTLRICKEKHAHVMELLKEFPDLEEFGDRWNNIYFKAKSADSKVNQVWFNHNCGCCADSPYQAWPYIEFAGEKIHSSLGCIVVGESDDYEGERPYPNWEEKVKDLPPVITDIIRQNFKENKSDDEEE